MVARHKLAVFFSMALVPAIWLALTTCSQSTMLTGLQTLQMSSELPSVPTGLAVGSANATSSTLTITWSSTSKATAYALYRASSASGPFTNRVYNGPLTTYTDTGLSSSTTYYYEIKATNTAGSSALSTAVSGATTLALPLTPTGLAVGTPTSTTLSITWNVVAGAASYELFRSTSSSGPFSNQVYNGSLATYTDTGLSPSTTYYYEVKATNSAGSSALSSAVFSSTTLASPTGLSVGSATSTTLTVSWNTSSGATSYSLYRATSSTGSYVPIYTGPSTTFVDGSSTALTSSTTYYYEVLAINSAGSSTLSSAASGTTGLAIPLTPTGLTVGTPTSNSLTVTWNTVNGAATYQLNCATSAGGTYSAVYNGPLATFTNINLSPSTTYYYEVQATNATGSSNFSSSVSGTTSAPSGGVPPSAPANIAVSSPTSTTLTVNWSASSGANTYQIYCSTSASGSYIEVSSVSGTSFTDGSLTPATTYYYKVVATNSAGSSALSSYASGTTAPATPSGLAVNSPTSTTLTVSWIASSGTNNSYQLYRSTSASGTYSPVYSGTGTSYVDGTGTALNPNTTYYYEVMATSGTESSALSSYVSGTTAPATPTGLAVNSPTSTTLTVSWNSSSGATGYLLYRSSSASGTYSQIYSGNVTSYMDGSGTVLTPYTTYYYEVMAINGTASSALSSYVSGTTTPATPTGLAVSSPTSTTLTLSWNTSAGATGYQLYRSTSASGTYSDVYSGTATSDQDGSLNTGATYYYEVVATNGSLSSAPSSVVSGTTLPVAPNTPVLVASTPRQITVNWTVTTGAATYNLYYKATSQVTTSSYDAEVTGLTGTSTTVSSLADDTTYYFILTGVNATGGEGAASAAGLSATTAPAPPTGLTVSNRGLTSITLTWTPGAGASTYNLYYNAGTTVSSSNSKIAGVSSGYTISPLTAATQYSFAATSADATSRESVLSTPATTSTITQATLYPNSTGSVVEGYTGNPTTNLSSQFLSSNEFAIVYFDTSSLTGHSILNGYLSTGVWGMVWDPSLNLQVDEIASSWSGISSVTWAETGSYSKSSSSTVGTAAYYTNTAVSIDVTSIVNDWANTSNGGAFIQTGPYSYDYLTLQPYGYSTYLTVEY